MTEADDAELADRVAELEDALRELQTDIADEQEFPRLPRPSELLRLTDQHAIPIAIAFLEAHIHALKILQGVIRMTGASDGPTAEGRESVSRAAVSRLDAIISDLRDAPMPEQADARELLEQAHQLRDDLSDRTEAAGKLADETPASDAGVDVDAELDAIRSDVRDEDDDEDQSAGSNR